MIVFYFKRKVENKLICNRVYIYPCYTYNNSIVCSVNKNSAFNRYARACQRVVILVQTCYLALYILFWLHANRSP